MINKLILRRQPATDQLATSKPTTDKQANKSSNDKLVANQPT